MLCDPEAKETYNVWRRKWRSEQVEEKTGFFNRVPDHVLKVSMCICLSRYQSALVINQADIIEAVDKVTSLIYSNKLAGNVTKSVDPITVHSKTVLNTLIAADENKLTRKNLLNRCYSYGLCDMSTLDKIVDTLLEMGWLEKERVGVGKNTDWLFKLSGEPLENYKKFVEQQKEKKL